MAVKLKAIKDEREITGLSEKINKELGLLLDSSNKDIDAINKYFESLYLEEVNKNGKANGTLGRLVKAIKSGMLKAMKTVNDNRKVKYKLFTTSIKSSNGDIPCMLAGSGMAPMVTKAVDHTSIRTSGLIVMALFNNKSRSPIRVEYEGISYPVLLTKNDVDDKLNGNKELDEDIRHEVGYIKDILDTKNTFAGFSSLTLLAKMFYDKEKKINTEMKCTKLNKELEAKWKNKTSGDMLELTMSAINLIGINTIGEAKKLGALIKKEPDKELRINVIKKIFGQA